MKDDYNQDERQLEMLSGQAADTSKGTSVEVPIVPASAASPTPTNTVDPIDVGLFKMQANYALLPEAKVGEPACIVFGMNGERKTVSLESAKQYMRDAIQVEIEAGQNTNSVTYSVDYSEDDGWNLEIDMPMNDRAVGQMLEESDETIYALFNERMIRGLQDDFDILLGTGADVGINIMNSKGDVVLRVYSPAGGGDTLGDSPDMPGVYHVDDADVWGDEAQDSDVWSDDTQESAQNPTESQGSKRFNTFEQALQYYGVTLDNVDVQYDMPHLFTEYFSLEGVAHLENFYFYGYSGLESTYFNLTVEPKNGGDPWSIYCDRNVFADLFDFAKKNGRFNIKTICRMDLYEPGQGGNFATLHLVG